MPKKMFEKEPGAELAGTSLKFTCAVLMVAILYLDLVIPLGIAVPILYNAVLLLALRSPDRRFVLAVALVACLLTIGPLLNKPAIEEMWKAGVNRLLAVATLGIACYLGLHRQMVEQRRLRAIDEREKALAEVRVLRGFLPICASCKRIRDYEGAWTMIEKYISEHSEAEFSHGLCPECTARLFPELDQNPQRRE